MVEGGRDAPNAAGKKLLNPLRKTRQLKEIYLNFKKVLEQTLCTKGHFDSLLSLSLLSLLLTQNIPLGAQCQVEWTGVLSVTDNKVCRKNSLLVMLLFF